VGKGVAQNLTALLTRNIPIGVATGRGKSAKRDLRVALAERFWPRVVVGYYNGFETALLSDDTVPSRQVPSSELRLLSAELSAHPFISKHATCDVRAGQISLTPATSVPPDALWQIVTDLIQERKFNVVMSSHAVDVVPANVSKLVVLERIRELFGLNDEDPILCIGDRGRPPGNDSLLLARPHALSVHEVSADPELCWNLAPPGHRGVQALLDYFKAFRIKNRQFRVAAHALIKGGF
jgi:hydroxymethylpyrimidine pyrophosphatase-like HAD family hydrolase